MMLMLTTDDFRQLSANCQAELLALLKGREATADSWEPSDEPSVAGFYFEQPHHPNASDALGTKRVIDIDSEKARQLIANISERSLDTLKLFATGNPVQLSSLLGDNGAYQDVTELKRSFIGAVNRRLRTVTGNRQAVLFGADPDQERIHVRPLTAASLRLVLNLPEPLPNFTVYGADGHEMPGAGVKERVRKVLLDAWKSFSKRPSNEHSRVAQDEVLRHFVYCGLSLYGGHLKTWDEELESEVYMIDSTRQLDGATIDLLDYRGEVTIGGNNGSDNVRIFLSHPELSGMFVLPVIS